MKAVILDNDSLGEGVDLSPIENQVNELICHSLTSPEQVDERSEERTSGWSSDVCSSDLS